MKKRTAHTTTFNAYAFCLALLMSVAFGGKEVHILLEHNHSNLEKCHVQAGETHLHAYEDLEHGCSLCDFTFSFFTFQRIQFTLLKQICKIPNATFVYTSQGLFLHPSFVALRGPPIAA